MANIEKRELKDGGLSYRITVTVGRDTSGKLLKHRKTYRPPETWSEARAAREAQRIADRFEDEVREGFKLDNRQTFAEYADYVLNLKSMSGVKASTIERYTDLLRRINPVFGHMKLIDIRPDHLNSFYLSLRKEGSRNERGKAVAIQDLRAIISKKKLTLKAAAEQAGVAVNVLSDACKGKTVAETTANKIAALLGGKPEKYFKITRNMTPLSDKTILEIHRFISTILTQAEKEMLVPYNAAAKASPPRPKKPEVNYFQPETVHAILDAAETEPLKYKVFINLLAVTGARRGELAGLQWKKIDLHTGQLTIEQGLYYSCQRGVYLGDTKTGEHRSMRIPAETVTLLKQLHREQLETRLKNGDRWIEGDYVFTQDNGKPVNPQTWTQWLSDFSKRHNLPHINPHAFRHTAASVLIAHGTDVSTVSKMLGHSSVTTTENFYTHLIEEAKTAASDTLTDVLLRRKA